MRFFKNIFASLHIFVLWLMASCLLWGWIFTFVTDTTPEKKISVYCDVPALDSRHLAVALEEHIPADLEMIKVYAFDYVMFDKDAFDQGDIFIVPASESSDFVSELLPLGDDGGTLVYDAATGQGAAASYIRYGDENYYLYLGSASVHLDDGKAKDVAMRLLELK